MQIEWFCCSCGWWVRLCIYLSLIWECMSTVGPFESKSLCCFFFQGKPPPTSNPEGNRKSKLLRVNVKWRRHPVALVCIFAVLTVHTHFLYFWYYQRPWLQFLINVSHIVFVVSGPFSGPMCSAGDGHLYLLVVTRQAWQ